MTHSLSQPAQEILALLESVRVHPDTEKHLEADERPTARKWLPMDNILNGHVEGVADDYKALMDKLHSALNGHLISPKGGHSDIYYELKKAGYNLRTGEQDSFGPLSAVVVCPNGEWQVCYG